MDPQQKPRMGILRSLLSKPMWVVLLLGFSSGLPIMLLYSSIKIWLRREGVELSTIGFLSWITIPYSFNYLWAFLLDRFIPSKMGRRRSWMLITQLALMGSLMLLGLGDPKVSLTYIVAAGFLVCVFSATQDIVIDAYRREILPDEELGIGASIAVYGYRTGMLVASGFGLWVVDPQTLGLSFNHMFFMMAGLMSVGFFTTLWCQEPKVHSAPPVSFHETVIEPFKEFLLRPQALMVLGFVLCFKLGDSIAGSMLSTFYVDLGFDNKTIAEITKGIGFISSMAGLLVGGFIIYRMGILRALWGFGILQAISTLFIAILTFESNKYTLSAVVAFEDFSSGMGTAAMVAFMASLTNKKFTATQYALLSSLASFGRTFLAGFSGTLIEATGYRWFFITCCVLAVPGLFLLSRLVRTPRFQGEPEELIERESSMSQA